jgi:hypothetical protein
MIMINGLLAEDMGDGAKNYFMEMPEIVRETDKGKN